MSKTFEHKIVSCVSLLYQTHMDQKQQIVTRTLDLFKKYGTRSVTMDDLSRELGISKKTLYEHFDNKHLLVEAAMNHQISLDEIAEANIQRSSKNAVEEIAALSAYHAKMMVTVSPVALYDMVKYHKQLWDNVTTTKQERDCQHMAKNIERGKSEGLYRTDVDAYIVSRLFLAMMVSILVNPVFTLEQLQNGRVFAELIDFYMHAVCSPTGLQLWKQHKQTQPHS
jgi:AcrR family transcriptional regulator